MIVLYVLRGSIWTITIIGRRMPREEEEEEEERRMSCSVASWVEV
jgi:hypothetical protein